MTKITRENIDELLDAHKLQVLGVNGSWYTIRRNGKTKRWKRDTSRIRVPVKIGFYNHYAITEGDFTSEGILDPLWRVEED